MTKKATKIGRLLGSVVVKSDGGKDLVLNREVTLMPSVAAHAVSISGSTETMATKEEFRLSPRITNDGKHQKG